MFNKLYQKSLALAAHKSSKIYLAIVSFIESSFFPIPPDVMIIPMVISKKNEFIRIALIATIFSVLGALFGYYIGYSLNEIAIKIFANNKKMGKNNKNATKLFQRITRIGCSVISASQPNR